MTLALGFLVGPRRLERLLGGGESGLRERAHLFAHQHGVRLLFTTPSAVDLDRGWGQLTGVTDGGRPARIEAPLPRIYFNCLRAPGRAERRALRDLNGDHRAVVFNETNRIGRLMLFEMLVSDPESAALVPPTEPLAPGVVTLYPSGLLLLTARRRSPVTPGGSVLLTLTSSSLQYAVLGGGPDGQVDRGVAVPWFGSLPPWLQLVSRLSGRPVGPGGLPVEWRFYVQRHEHGTWQAVAMVAKYQGLRLGGRERCWPLREALALTFGAGAGRMQDRLFGAALAVARVLSRYVPGVTHLAVDLWVDVTGKITLLDLAGYYRVDWLRRIGDEEGLIRVISHPARFARAIAQAGAGKLYVGQGT